MYLQNFDKQVQALVLNEMAAGGRWFISEIPECAQCKFEGGVHRALRGLLAHDVKQLLQGERRMFPLKKFLFLGNYWRREIEQRVVPSRWTALLPAGPSAPWTTGKSSRLWVQQYAQNAGIIQHKIYLSGQYGNDGHSHPLHVLVLVVTQPLHDEFGSFEP